MPTIFMLRSKPKLTYCGLTIIMSNPSRFDTARLLSANGGLMFDNHCLRPEFNSMQCDIRLMEDTTPILPNTKCILILGESAMHKYLPETINSDLGAMRGSLFYYNNIPTICSFNPQEAVDLQNYEATHNVLSKDYTPDDALSSDGEDEDEGNVKAFGRTKRANYSFWLQADVRKCKKILLQSKPSVLPSPSYRIYPPSEEVINILRATKNTNLYFDIETDYEEQNLQCFSFAFYSPDSGLSTVYSVPILDYNYKPAYSSYHHILRALAVAFRDNTVVAHNGATFDFFVMANKYHIPVIKAYDTMIAMQRCFPDIERSLGHCVSYWTWEKFHKDEDSHSYHTMAQMNDRMKYCGKDVYTMFLVHQAIEQYAKKIPGLSDSISAAMNCIRPYLTSTLQGVRVDEEKVKTMINENDRLMVQYNRMIEILVGFDGMRQVRAVIKGKPSMMAGSNTQCCEYFHSLLGYAVVAKGKENKFTGVRKPSLGKKALYKLALKYENPVINLICAYRAVAKETSRLRFEPWIMSYGK